MAVGPAGAAGHRRTCDGADGCRIRCGVRAVRVSKLFAAILQCRNRWEGKSVVLQFKILGPLEVVYKGCVCAPLPRKVRSVLGLLLARANQVVDVDSLVAELWCASPPRTAVATAQTYIFHLRR